MRRFEPFGEGVSLRQMMDRLIEDAWIQPARLFGGEHGGFPIDIREEDDHVVVRASLPGMRPEDVDITVTGNMLTIRGETRFDSEADQPSSNQRSGQQSGEQRRSDWRQREIRYGRFERVTTLPSDVVAEDAQAQFENGILTLRMPKAETAKPKRIQVGGRSYSQQRPTMEGTREGAGPAQGSDMGQQPYQGEGGQGFQERQSQSRMD